MAASQHRGLTDTDILIDAARGMVAATSFVAARHGSAGLHVSVVSAMELIMGCRNTRELPPYSPLRFVCEFGRHTPSAD